MDQPAPVEVGNNELELSFDGSWLDVVFLAGGMALIAWLLWLVYRTMQRPRLPVNHHEDRPPNATWSGVLRYALTIPFVVAFWLFIFLWLLSMAAQDRTATDVIVASTAVIGGARLLAHLKEEIAHELAKTVPITILGFIIIGGGFAGMEEILQVLTQLDDEVPLIDSYWGGLILFDVLLTSAWFLTIRWKWLRRRRREDLGEPTENVFVRIRHRWRSIGYTQAHRSTEPIRPEIT